MTQMQSGPPTSPPGHPDLDTLADYGAGVLDPAQTAQLRTHVDTCERCQGVLAGSAAVPDLLRTLPPVAMPAAVEARIFAALDAERQARGIQPAGGPPRPGPVPIRPASGVPAGSAPTTAGVASLDAARERRRRRIVALSKMAAGIAVVVGLGAGLVAISNGGSENNTNAGGGNAGAAAEPPQQPQVNKGGGNGVESDGAGLPNYTRQTLTQSSLLTDILNGHNGPLTPVPAQDADRLRGCEQSVGLQVPAVGTASPMAVKHIRFEGTPAYLLVYGGSQPTAVVVGDTCTATVTQVLFTKPL